MSKIANRQSLAFSERSQLSQASPQRHVERMSLRVATQPTQSLWAPMLLYFGGDMAANAGDSNRSENSG